MLGHLTNQDAYSVLRGWRESIVYIQPVKTFSFNSHSLCQAEIAKHTATYTKVVCDLKHNLIGSAMEPHPSREISHTLLPLPLPSDATLSEFRQLIHPHITELAI